ncbi:MAG TPA: bifunctional glutamate N-acetyltransferase/amino-acid acetyltransferase ArgJ [Kofleriaceae bacterium]|jgi:acetylglutamate kinase|nr:bifunctional glutamate N-acetyltransferase/amino-acid acetyltransferase ArgJ [Kofleriaceae bacterium]
MKLPRGFRFAAVAAGIRPSKPDVALFVSDCDAAGAGVFTVNRARSYSVADAARRLPSDAMRAIVVMSGNANAMTGAAGVEATDAVLAAAARALGVDRTQVASAATGVIGMRLPADKVVAALPRCVAQLGPDPTPVADAIMTTDTTRKMASRTVNLDGTLVTLTGICKGSGMIAPQLATMIAVIVTDCAIDARTLDAAVKQAAPDTFDQLVIDGDMSTNDSVFVLANGLAGNPRLTSADAPGFRAFTAALTDLCDELARDIAADGEGATKRLEVRVAGAPSPAVARDIAKAICVSPLVKAAMFGQDPNWGRIMMTIGARCGSQQFDVDPARAAVAIQGTAVYDQAPVAFDRAQLKARLREPEVVIAIDLRAGTASGKAYGCDLSYDYVKLNADYTSVLFEAPDGGVRKDDRIGNYSPAFKRALLVQALGYISRFRGTRCVIHYGGAALARDGLRRAFCDDVMLLHSVGLSPVVVHGGGPELAHALEASGSALPGMLIDGMRGAPASDARVAEMMTGSVNTELVTVLNRAGGHAVGLSGKDAALLRARKRPGADARDAAGELVEVNKGFLESLLGQHYIPVIAPVGLGTDGEGYQLDAHVVAAEIARALGADKLMYLADVPGIVEAGELVTDLTPATLRGKLDAGVITNGTAGTAAAALAALAGGVRAVHLIDGRIPHNIIAELFTDTGVGTIVRAE